MPLTRQCRWCQGEYEPRANGQVYCSGECKRQWQNARKAAIRSGAVRPRPKDLWYQCDGCGLWFKCRARRDYCTKCERAAARQAAERAAYVGPRVCLGCGEAFESEGPWNRVCPACSQGEQRACAKRGIDRSALAC